MQNTNKHTSGPWLVGPEYENKQSRAVWHGDFSDTATTVARFVKTEADARLIASSPELLTALEEIEKSLTALLCERVLDSTLPEFYTVRDARNAARAAIARATGQD